VKLRRCMLRRRRMVRRRRDLPHFPPPLAVVVGAVGISAGQLRLSAAAAAAAALLLRGGHGRRAASPRAAATDQTVEGSFAAAFENVRVVGASAPLPRGVVGVAVGVRVGVGDDDLLRALLPLTLGVAVTSWPV
jgi:hypothetical protein